MVTGSIILLIFFLVWTVLMLLYFIYEPFLDIIESGGQRWFVLWYKSKDSNTGRNFKKLFRLRDG